MDALRSSEPEQSEQVLELQSGVAWSPRVEGPRRLVLWMPLLFSRPRRRVLFEIHEPCPGAFRYIGLRISVDESSELAETLRLVARPREIEVYEPVGSNYVLPRSFSRKTLY